MVEIKDISDMVRFMDCFDRYHPTSPHSIIVRVTSTEDVVKVVNIARKYRISVTPYSGATSLEGHFGGVRFVLSFLFFCRA